MFKPWPYDANDLFAWLCQGDIELGISMFDLDEFRHTLEDCTEGNVAIETMYWRFPFTAEEAAQILEALDKFESEDT